jgi:hypothetical protein
MSGGGAGLALHGHPEAGLTLAGGHGELSEHAEDIASGDTVGEVGDGDGGGLLDGRLGGRGGGRLGTRALVLGQGEIGDRTMKLALRLRGGLETGLKILLEHELGETEPARNRRSGLANNIGTTKGAILAQIGL